MIFGKYFGSFSPLVIQLKPIKQMQGWVSPRLDIRFDVVEKELQVYHSNGKQFASYVELVEQREQERQRAERAESALETTEEALEQSQEALEQSQESLEQERNRVQALLEQLRARGIDPSDLDLG